MADDAYKLKPAKIDNVTQQKSTDGPHRGGNKYNQMTMGQGFMTQKPIAGHTQQQNIDEKTQQRPNKK